ncbi:MAG: DedA family protein [Deltaproteobacteria bacterium]|nr:DedA family protein [Deltaproteobacteria bacterium]
MGQAVEWIIQTVGQLGYPGIFILMLLESSFFPFPSEVVMIPAGYLAYQGQMSMAVAIAMGILGSLAGALLNYWLALWLGRPFLEKYGRFVLLTPDKLKRVDSYFQAHGEISTFIGRLITVVRQYISFPAGLCRMHLGRFLLYTGLGAGLWVTVLAGVGYIAGDNQGLIKKYSQEATWSLLAFCVLLLAVYIIRHRRKKAA